MAGERDDRLGEPAGLARAGLRVAIFFFRGKREPASGKKEPHTARTRSERRDHFYSIFRRFIYTPLESFAFGDRGEMTSARDPGDGRRG